MGLIGSSCRKGFWINAFNPLVLVMLHHVWLAIWFNLFVTKWINCNFFYYLNYANPKKCFIINIVQIFITKKICRRIRSIMVNGLRWLPVISFLSHTWSLSTQSALSFCFCFNFLSFSLSLIPNTRIVEEFLCKDTFQMVA